MIKLSVGGQQCPLTDGIVKCPKENNHQSSTNILNDSLVSLSHSLPLPIMIHCSHTVSIVYLKKIQEPLHSFTLLMDEQAFI